MIYRYSDIREVHLELTDRCNAACPMCPRFVDGREAPYIEGIELRLQDIQELFPPSFIQQLTALRLCGNYGDPIVAHDLIPIIEHFQTWNPNIFTMVNTNGSARTEDWWFRLGETLRRGNGGVWFAIDGLPETNHIYRRNTSWELISRNVKAYMAAGGEAHWNYIVFKHNERDVAKAIALSKVMGFSSFTTKRTGRFGEDRIYPVFNRHGVQEGQLEAPSTYIPAPVVVNPGTISCVAKQEDAIYMSARGLVYPCCWIAMAHDTTLEMDGLDPRQSSIAEIVEGPAFQMIYESWRDGSVPTCVEMCGQPRTKKKEVYGT